jgi:hypothetical protein
VTVGQQLYDNDLRSIVNICSYENILYSTFNKSASATLFIILYLSRFYFNLTLCLAKP